MKQDMNLEQLSNALIVERAMKRDFIASGGAVRMAPDAKTMAIANIGSFGITDLARRQLADKLGIPAAFFDRLQDKYPALLAENVNTIISGEAAKHMVRTVGGDIRALLSDRYRTLDNFDLADAVIPTLVNAKAQIVSCSVTERKMYIKALAPWLDRELPIPPGLKMGEGHNFFVRKVIGAITISNSEVGCGKLSIAPGIFEKQCTNLSTFKDEGYGKMHVGRKADDDDGAYEFLTDETKRLDDAAVWARARDMVVATLDGRVIDKLVQRMIEARGDAITGDPVKVVEVFAKRNGFTEDERGGLMRHLVGSGEMTRYGLQWAITRLAGDVENYDRASDLERLGGAVIELPRQDWELLAKAA